MNGIGTPTTEDLEKIAADSIGVIERDSGRVLDERTRRVIEHWMVCAMRDVRNRTLAAHRAALTTLAARISIDIDSVR